MNSAKPDRRIQRTQQALRDALIALILEKGYDAITVQDLLDRANLGRSTFYAHFQDKEDLLLSGFEALFASFQQEYQRQGAPSAGDPAQAGRDLSLFFFRHAATHQGLYKAMIGERGGKVILEHALAYLTGFIRDHLAADLPASQKGLPLDLLAHYIASSYLALLTWWLDHDMPYPPEQMDAIYQQLVLPGLRALLIPAGAPNSDTGKI